MKLTTKTNEQFDSTCYIIGGGPSLKNFDWSRLDGKFVVGINRAYEVLPEAQIIYLTDKEFWDVHKEGLLAHKGQLMRGMLDPTAEKLPPEVIKWHLTGHHGLEMLPGKLKHGINSTYAALNMMTVHMKFKRVYLLGVDMKWGNLGKKDTSHWHNGHKRVDAESIFKSMKRSYDTIAGPLKELGYEVYNANPDSGLNAFPKVTIDEALDGKHK